MKKYLLGSITALMLSPMLAGTAAHAEGAYVSILGGATFDPHLMAGGTSHDMSPGYNGGARFGFDLEPMMGMSGFSLEADAFYNRSGYRATGAHLASTSYMGDLVYHFGLGLPLNLYGGGGIGAVTTQLGGTLPHGSSTVLGWQALGGVEFPVSSSMAIFTEYRYQNANAANVSTTTHVGNTSNNLSFGVKFSL